MLNLRHEAQAININHIGGKVIAFWKAMNDQGSQGDPWISGMINEKEEKIKVSEQ